MPDDKRPEWLAEEKSKEDWMATRRVERVKVTVRSDDQSPAWLADVPAKKEWSPAQERMGARLRELAERRQRRREALVKPFRSLVDWTAALVEARQELREQAAAEAAEERAFQAAAALAPPAPPVQAPAPPAPQPGHPTPRMVRTVPPTARPAPPPPPPATPAAQTPRVVPAMPTPPPPQPSAPPPPPPAPVAPPVEVPVPPMPASIVEPPMPAQFEAPAAEVAEAPVAEVAQMPEPPAQPQAPPKKERKPRANPLSAVFSQAKVIQDRREEQRQAERSQIMHAIRRMNDEGYETMLLDFFRRDGYTVYRVDDAGASAADLELHRERERILVSIKQRGHQVGQEAVRDLDKEIASSVGVTGGFLFTDSNFTEAAVRVANNSNVTLVDGTMLAELIEELTMSELRERKAGARLAKAIGWGRKAS